MSHSPTPNSADMEIDGTRYMEPYSRRSSTFSADFTIDETKEYVPEVHALTEEEKASMGATTMLSSGYSFEEENTDILWHGVIFENVQCLRHFKDSKEFVDHVLKTSAVPLIKESFNQQVLNYQPSSSGLKSSMSFGNTQQRTKHTQLKLVEPYTPNSPGPSTKPRLKNIESFPKIANLNQQYKSVLDQFMKSYFFNPGFELMAGQTPPDWKEEPDTDLFTKILVPSDDDDIHTEFLAYFAKELNRLWKILYRVQHQDVSQQPCRYSFIPLKHPGIFVPGGRFREIYYWDSFWIIQGLLCCGMVQSSINLVETLADLVDKYGFIPNGTRKYYLTRSQPPLLTPMVHEIYTVTKDKKWLQSILPSLTKEYEYWTSPPIQVSIVKCVDDQKCDNDKKYKFARYFSSDGSPRPESFYEDRMTALLEDDQNLRENIYRNIRATAASGWDFSSRWYYDENGAYGNHKIPPRKVKYNVLEEGKSTEELLTLMEKASIAENIEFDGAMSVDEELFDEFAQTRIQFTNEFSMACLDTCNVVPIDLNIFLCKVEGYLSEFCLELGDKEKADKYKQCQTERIDSILEVLWCDESQQFRDWNFRYKCYGNPNMASNFIPLWLECDHEEFNQKKELLVETLCQCGVVCGGGIVTTLHDTGEQWDYPNCWAPLNSIIIEGLHQMGKDEYALKLAKLWINNNYHTYLASKKMHEKYHCERYGGGGGGEYKPQFGFGWTNGVCLKLLQMFGRQLKISQTEQEAQQTIANISNDK
eukprot:CAMPEP_0197050822 /NCGR_PEP_ID=MMETSP1384-20130603/25635_1 /TAXON_ID=29189 /ORGANISM="Ammonia sp." /LENGTH=758 /DNA_ID=CAMNT_0042483289 /DNA_START=46 /DNA_END=2322 /DNA_ORIENTATION=-